MKNKLFLLFLVAAVFIFCKAIEAQELVKDRISYIALPDYFGFSDHKNFSIELDEEESKGTYTLDVQDKITFVNVNFSNGKKERFLLLASNVIGVLYNSDGNRVAFGMSGGANRANVVDGPGSVSASSFLKEGAVSYLPKNISDWDKTDKPWVEGVDGYGIGEKLIFNCSPGSFHISIGYVSYKKPYLYTQNSRPKTIKITVEGEEPIIVELKDTPHYQQVMHPGYGTTVLEILDVYPGTKYKDTCINSIICDMSDPKRYTVYEYWKE